MSEVQNDLTVEEVPQEVSPTEETQIQIQIEDIINAAKIIEVAMERGTFKARELIEVTAVYQNLLKFSDEIEKNKGE